MYNTKGIKSCIQCIHEIIEPLVMSQLMAETPKSVPLGNFLLLRSDLQTRNRLTTNNNRDYFSKHTHYHPHPPLITSVKLDYT